MNNYKAIILGAQCSGKTTLVKYLQSQTDLNVIEQDVILMERNGGVYPTDDKYKHEVLLPQVERDIISGGDIIFVSSYFDIDLLQEAHDKGFKIIILSIALEELLRRNKKRMEIEHYDDASTWMEVQLKGHQEILDKGLVDITIDVTQPVEKVAQDVLDYLDIAR